MSDLRENQKIKIFFDANDIDMELECTIRTVYNDRIGINFPEDAMQLAKYLEVGTELEAKVFTPIGLKVFDSVVINSPDEDEFIVEYAEDTVHIQRREYSRSPLKTKLTLEINREILIASTIDISGGGIKFCSKEELDPEQTVKGKLFLRNFDRSISFDGVILDNPSLSPDEYTLSFTNIEERERDKIIKTCFEIDMQLSKGLD